MYHCLPDFTTLNRFMSRHPKGPTHPKIDRDNITSNNQITEILGRSSKDVGVSAFSKYHFELLEIIREKLNFTVNYRNARGWAGKVENSTYRLGYIGIMQRNEADIGASASYNRINRFADFDIIQQSWKFESSFLFLFTPNLNAHNKRGNFLAPFEPPVWTVTLVTLITLIIIWVFIEHIARYLSNTSISNGNPNGYMYGVPLNVVAAICQQGLDPIPREISSRIITITTFIFSLVMYNYYTSSVVGGLLSNTAQGPTTVEEITSSDLRLSFEDIGYYKIHFRVSREPTLAKLYKDSEPARLNNENRFSILELSDKVGEPTFNVNTCSGISAGCNELKNLVCKFLIHAPNMQE
ncbi:ionotropic receptor 75a [Calliphora vicina]|uniref:ionotropic receptor 75a n=1 Tax=Calliphora vicina TaxID=7373 RepID=UPI00325AA7D9